MSSQAHDFGALAHQWWDPNGPMRTLHHINPTRVTFITTHLDDHTMRGPLLDVGCGAGILTEALAEQGHNVTGIDVSENLIHIAKKHAALSNLDIAYHCGALHQDSPLFSSEQFSAITCLEVIEHVAHPMTLLSHCAHHLKPGGLLFVSTINATWQAYFETILMAEHVLKLIPKGTHQYRGFVKPSRIMQWARQNNHACLSIKGLRYNPLNQQCKTTTHLGNNYILCLQKLATPIK